MSHTPPPPDAGAPVDLVIFDCDGVLVDSEPLSLGTLTAGLNRIGVAIDVETVRARFAGTAMPSIMGHIERDYGIAAPEGFVEAVKEETLRVFDRALRPMPGIAEVVGALDVPTCVASSSDPVRLAHSLGLTGLLPLFEGRIYSATMVSRGKPAPDLFLYAAERMGVEPGRCLVVEDSVPGVMAASAAGMRVLGFTGGGHWRHDPEGADLAAAGAGRVYADHHALPGLILRA